MSHPSVAPVPLNLVRPSAPLACRVLANERLTPPERPDVRHLVIAVPDEALPYLEGQSVGVIAPGTDEAGKPHRLRLYSIASAREGDRPGTLSLCVKRVRYTDEAGHAHLGTTSNHLCDLAPGESVQLCGPVGKHFLLPDAPEAPLLMIATGTGIAPFRAFVRRRAATGAQARDFLVFGVRTPQDLIYGDELAAALGDRLRIAYSDAPAAEAPDMRFVGDRLPELADAVWPLLLEGALHVYLCGVRGMEPGVEAAFAAMAGARGHDWTALRTQLIASGRWRAETY